MVRARAHAVLTLLAALLALPAAAASAAQPADLFNAHGQLHAIACVPLALPQADLRYTDTSPTGFTVNDQLTFNDGRCPSNTVRLDHHEIFPAGDSGLVFHRGGNGYSDEPNTKYGQLLTGDLTALPDTVPSGGGRGAPCARLATGPAHAVNVESIPEEMHYKHPSELANGSNRGSSYEHYGDPGADQGDRTDIHYTYLLWSFVNVRGGGIVRVLLKDGQTVRPCDVDPISYPSWDRDGNVNGSVQARYVEAIAGNNCRVYGWMVWSHDYQADAAPAVAHATPAPGAPAPGTGDARCPMAAPASPPTVDTTDATGQLDGTAALSGSVHPEGTPTTYRFEYGNGPEFGWVTEPRPLSNAMRTNSVSQQIGSLTPGATYHYRIVASGQHGTSAGPTRTFTMPAPPPPPPPPEPVALSGLQVAPVALKRSRHRLGSSASIRYVLSKPATVTLTFAQARRGMLVGTRCKTPPRRGIPRGRRRCTRWVGVPGVLIRQAQAGAAKLRFGGWVGRRPLARGRYRVQALPSDGGPAAQPQRAGFRVR